MINYKACPDDWVPKTLDDAIQFFLSRLDREGWQTIKAWDEDRWLVIAHHSVGREMRNLWGLWEGNGPLRQWFVDQGITHPDDMSGIILRSIHRTIRETQIQVEAQIEHYKKFWRDQQV